MNVAEKLALQLGMIYAAEMLIYASMLVAAFILASIIYRYDIYDKEPWYLLALVFFFGMAACWACGFIEDIIIVKFRLDDSIAGMAMNAAIVEELAKLLIVVFVALVFRSHFDDPMDGLIYGAYAGLGAAVQESFFYIGLEEARPSMVGQEVLRLILHTLMGGIDGFGIGLARFQMRHWKKILCSWMIASITIHFFWDCVSARVNSGTDGLAWKRIEAFTLMIALIAIFAFSVMYGSRLSRAMLAPKSRKRLWGWPLSLLFRNRD